MRDYEILLVIDSGFDEEHVEPMLTKFADLIKSEGGEIVSTDTWGKRRLAYPIKKKTYGYYVIHYVKMPGTAIKPMRRIMDRTEELLRYMFIFLDKRDLHLREKQAEINQNLARQQANRQQKDERRKVEKAETRQEGAPE